MVVGSKWIMFWQPPLSVSSVRKAEKTNAIHLIWDECIMGCLSWCDVITATEDDIAVERVLKDNVTITDMGEKLYFYTYVSVASVQSEGSGLVFSNRIRHCLLLSIISSPFLSSPCAGPYSIVKCLSYLNYLISTSERKKKVQVCHINLLKVYILYWI